MHLNRRFYVMTARPELEVLTVRELSKSPTETDMYSSFEEVDCYGTVL